MDFGGLLGLLLLLSNSIHPLSVPIRSYEHFSSDAINNHSQLALTHVGTRLNHLLSPSTHPSHRRNNKWPSLFPRAPRPGRQTVPFWSPRGAIAAQWEKASSPVRLSGDPAYRHPAKGAGMYGSRHPKPGTTRIASTGTVW